jgi:hypothetical protein
MTITPPTAEINTIEQTFSILIVRSSMTAVDFNINQRSFSFQQDRSILLTIVDFFRGA